MTPDVEVHTTAGDSTDSDDYESDTDSELDKNEQDYDRRIDGQYRRASLLWISKNRVNGSVMT